LIADNSYKGSGHERTLAPGAVASIVVDTSRQYNWYDFSVKLKGYGSFEQRFAGRVETGRVTKTDPLMGGMA